ncbi:hypothetical protein B0H63DRAFT_538329 [Podospora didyma]|uniref:Uncharacterized protein n=1 Tax=Podospora didyma TaxID=330526 RepID=A0AAE0U4H3_9PEZI|nr:hypothetical protein B0H63DRAFT_538329 [Podospora didyma]
MRSNIMASVLLALAATATMALPTRQGATSDALTARQSNGENFDFFKGNPRAAKAEKRETPLDPQDFVFFKGNSKERREEVDKRQTPPDPQEFVFFKGNSKERREEVQEREVESVKPSNKMSFERRSAAQAASAAQLLERLKSGKMGGPVMSTVGQMCGWRQRYLEEMLALERELKAELAALDREAKSVVRVHDDRVDRIAELRVTNKHGNDLHPYSFGFRVMRERRRVRKELRAIPEIVSGKDNKTTYEARRNRIRADYDARRDALKSMYMQLQQQPAEGDVAADGEEFKAEFSLNGLDEVVSGLQKP